LSSRLITPIKSSKIKNTARPACKVINNYLNIKSGTYAVPSKRKSVKFLQIVVTRQLCFDLWMLKKSRIRSKVIRYLWSQCCQLRKIIFFVVKRI